MQPDLVHSETFIDIDPINNNKKKRKASDDDKQEEKKDDEKVWHPLPKVVKLKIKGGKLVQDCDVYIGRSLHMGGHHRDQSKWANPFTVQECGSVMKAVAKFKEYMNHPNQALLKSQVTELDNPSIQTLGCWCKNKPTDPCHGDVLVELIQEARLNASNKKLKSE